MKKSLTSLFMLFAFAMTVHATVHVVTIQSYVYTPSSLSINCNDTVRFTWIDGTHPTVSETGAWGTFTLDPFTTTQDVILTAAGTYAYYCAFHGAPGGLGMAGSISVTCGGGGGCSVPSGITATGVSSTKEKIQWFPVAGATKYQVQYRQSGTDPWLKTSTTKSQKVLTGLTAATTYEYKVKTICAAGASAFSAVQTFTTMLLDGGVIDYKTEPMGNGHVTQMLVYPNPAPGQFKLVLEHVHVESVLMQVYDLTGKLITEKTIPVNNMSIIDDVKLPEGFTGNALVKVIAGDKELTQDILVQ